MERCKWCCDNGILQKYHDEEWGIPLHDDRKHFEYISMEVMQCGLSWTLMLKKRDIFKKCFDNFDYEKIALYNENDIERILSTEGMIRSRAKISAIIGNAKVFLSIIDEFGSFDSFLWSFTEGYTYIYLNDKDLHVAKNELSEKISAELKKRGFKYLGPITLYSHLQACGIINSHSPDCFMYDGLVKNNPVKYIED
ncbi:MAG: DNA-3-methyladenine glycosylase I [Clostridiales bacterium]|nr:DNA-3-methyladenine glycosylase I [Clostridiales bacterium]